MEASNEFTAQWFLTFEGNPTQEQWSHLWAYYFNQPKENAPIYSFATYSHTRDLFMLENERVLHTYLDALEKGAEAEHRAALAAAVSSSSKLQQSSPKVHETSIPPARIVQQLPKIIKHLQQSETPKPNVLVSGSAPVVAKPPDPEEVKTKATNDAIREQFGKLCKLLETPGWWIVTLQQEELIARRCRASDRLSPGQFKLRAKKIGDVPVFGHFNKLAPAQADLMNVYRREIERLYDDPVVQKSIRPSQDDILKRIRKCAELARQEKLRREVEAELDALPDFNQLLQQMKKDMETD